MKSLLLISALFLFSCGQTPVEPEDESQARQVDELEHLSAQGKADNPYLFWNARPHVEHFETAFEDYIDAPFNGVGHIDNPVIMSKRYTFIGSLESNWTDVRLRWRGLPSSDEIRYHLTDADCNGNRCTFLLRVLIPANTHIDGYIGFTFQPW